jgi:acyl-CoA synthetase (AMP-forming)/AMP-acid ligase II
MTLPELFSPTFANRFGETALEFGRATYTFGDLDVRASRLAGLLSARGFCAGDRLAVYLENRVEFIDLFLACTRLGVILVPINILYRDREASHIVSDAEPKAIVAAGPVPGGFGHWDVTELSRAAAERSAVDRSASPGEILLSRLKSGGASTDSTPAAIVYTSGTTGTAKGAVLTHGNFAANATALLDAWRITMPTASCCRCRCFTCTDSAMACAAGLRPVAGCASSIASTAPRLLANSIRFGRRCSSASRRSMSGCSACLPMLP